MPAKVIPREFTGDAELLRTRSASIFDALMNTGVTHVIGVPDNATGILYEFFEAEPKVQVVLVCREGEAWAIASGLWVGGAVPVVIIQNTGFFESGDALRGTAVEMAIPILTLMDYRGYHTLQNDDPQTVDTAASLFEPTLKAWLLPYHFLTEGNEAEICSKALRQAEHEGRPVVVLMA